MSPILHPENINERMRVVEVARSWLRTPYHHMGRVKGVGVDCAQFPLAVFHEAGLIPFYKPENYSPDWHLHRSEERYVAKVREFARETDRLDPGNFMVYRWGRCYAHGVIIVKWPDVIHSMIRIGVTLARGDQYPLLDRDKLVFTVWE